MKERLEACKPCKAVLPDTRVLHYICADGNEVMFSQNSSFSKPVTLKRFSIFKQGYHGINPATAAANVDAPVIEDQPV